MSERRDPYDYHVRLSAGGPWRVATMQLHDSVEKWLVAGGAKRIYDTDDLAEIGPRILPPGSDSSPAAPASTLDNLGQPRSSWAAENVRRDQERASREEMINNIEESVTAAPTATDAMERAREAWLGISWGTQMTWPQAEIDKVLIAFAAAITSAVEQERQACALLAFSQTSDDPLPGDWNEACEHIAEMIRSRSAEPPDTERHLSISEQGTMKRALLRSSKPVPDTEGGE